MIEFPELTAQQIWIAKEIPNLTIFTRSLTDEQNKLIKRISKKKDISWLTLILRKWNELNDGKRCVEDV